MDDKAIPEIDEETSLIILEKLFEVKREYSRKINLPDDNGMYNSSPADQRVLNDIKAVIKWVAAGGFE